MCGLRGWKLLLVVWVGNTVIFYNTRYIETCTYLEVERMYGILPLYPFALVFILQMLLLELLTIYHKGNVNIKRVIPLPYVAFSTST